MDSGNEEQGCTTEFHSSTPKHASINLMVCIDLSLEGLMPVQLRSLQYGHRLETEHGLQDAMRCDENTM